MPLFAIQKTVLTPVESGVFDNEKKLQNLIEANLHSVFNCRLVATEFSTGNNHAGRIDTLALSEDNNPVIIEYKNKESSELINQSLFYLHWIYDHRGDFQVAVNKALGNGVDVDWGEVRVICIAPNYKKYDLHAVQVMGAHIELWTYRIFKNSSLYLEEVFSRSLPTATNIEKSAGLSAGKKAAFTRLTGQYTFEQHLEEKPEHIRQLALKIQEFILSIDPSIQEAPKKLYVAYKLAQNIVCMQLYKKEITLYLKLDPKEVAIPPNGRDVTAIGHFGTGDLELTLANDDDLQAAKPLIQLAYQKMGG